LLEAMSAGLSIIAPRLAVIREVASEKTAFLYGPNQGGLASSHNPTDIADAIVALEKDTATRQRIGEQARAHVIHSYSEGATLDAHSELYGRLLA
jgi:glycosyltransferase involved in cell wall biosynthesis